MDLLQVAPIANKGNGYVSTGPIQAGAILFRDPAIFSVGFERGLKPPKAAMTDLIQKFIKKQGWETSKFTMGEHGVLG